MSRTIGLDVGTKTIGVAVSDTIGMMAHPVTTVARKGVKQDVVKLATIVAERKVGQAVVGLPFELDGTEERSARLARQIGKALHEATGIPVFYVDERYTSVDAERQLIQANISRDKRKRIIDQQAAIIILQSYLEGGMTAVCDQEA